MSFHVPPALRHRNFRLMWFGQLISVAGSQMQLWGLFWHIRLISDQPIAVSGVGLARFLPVLIFSLVGGVIADRFNRRTVMFFTQTSMAVIAVLLGILTLNGTIGLWPIYLLTAVQAIALAFDQPSRSALIPNLVPVEDLPSAFGIQAMAFQVGAIIGPALCGLIIASFNMAWVYFINAGTFLAVILALVLIGPQPGVTQETASLRLKSSSPKGRIQANFGLIGDGIRFIMGQPIIMGSMILDFFATFFSSANTLLSYVTQDVLHANAIQYGWLSSAQSIGAVTASLIMSQFSTIKRQGPLLLISVIIFGLATILFGYSQTFGLTMIALILVGAGDAVSTVIRNTVRQILTPDAMRGRMVSINQIFYMGGPQLGEIEAGIVAQAYGTPMAIITGGLGCLVATAAVAWRWPELARYDGQEPETLAASPAD